MRLRQATNKSFWMQRKCILQSLLAFLANLLRLSIMNNFRGQETKAAMVMLVVVPSEELFCPDPGILFRAKTIGVIRTILHGLKV